MKSERYFEKMDLGTEADIYKTARVDEEGNQKENQLVIKDFLVTEDGYLAPDDGYEDPSQDVIPSRGFNQKESDRLQIRYSQLKKQYGDFIPLQHIIAKKDDPERFVLVQQRVEPSKWPDIFVYDSRDLSPRACDQLERFAELLKDSYRSFLGSDTYAWPVTDPGRKIKPDENTPLDLWGDNNIIITKSGDIKYRPLAK